MYSHGMGSKQTRYEYDPELLQRAGALLGTSGVKSTLDSALRSVINTDRRARLLEHLASADYDSSGERDEAWH